MAIIALPTAFSFTRVRRFGLVRGGNILRSRYTGQAQRVIYPFAVWEFEGNLVDYDSVQAANLRSFLVELEGFKNTFRLPVPGYSKPSTGHSSNTTSGVGAIGATTLAIAAGSIFGKGDYFTVNDELKVVTQVGATVSFMPPLRKAVTNGTAVTVINPTCLMHAVDEDVANWDLTPPNRHGIEIIAVEAIEV